MSGIFEQMSGLDLSGSIAAEQSGNNTEATTTSEESEIPFEANESTEGYALFGNSDKLVGAISTEVFDNDPVYSLLDWGMNLEDYEEIVEENDLNGQQKLDLIHKLAKGTFGERQGNLNEGYGMGWDTDKSPPKVYDNGKVDHVPYLDVFDNLPAFDHDTLDEGEIASLESEGLNMDDFGFDRSVAGPQLPVINGERVPILFEDGDEVVKLLKMLDSIDFDEVTYCPENGSLQGTPSLGDSEGETVETSSQVTEGDINLAVNPEEVGEVYVKPMEEQLEGISSERTIETMLRSEQEGKSRSTAVDAIEDRLEEVQSSDEEDIGTEDSSDEEVTIEEVATLFDLSDIEAEAVQHRVESGKAENYRGAAKSL